MMVCQEQKQMKERRRKNEPVLLLCFFERVCCYFDGKMGRRCRPEQNFSLKIPRGFNMTDMIITTAILFHPKFSLVCREKERSSKMLSKKIKLGINRL